MANKILRKTFRVWLPSLLALCVMGSRVQAQTRSVETPAAVLQLSERTGDLVGLHWKKPEFEVIREQRLGENFRLLVPKPAYEAAYFNSRDQNVSRIERLPDGVLCTYESLRNNQETIPVRVRYRIRVVGE